jgi:hypothetical protein
MSWPDGSKLVGEFLEDSAPHPFDKPKLKDILRPGTYISPEGKNYEWKFCNGNGALFDEEDNIIGKISMEERHFFRP